MATSTAHSSDHRRNTEELLTQLAGLMHHDATLAEEVRQACRRRAVARHSIAVRMLAERPRRNAAA
jgi:hypothetical protein